MGLFDAQTFFQKPLVTLTFFSPSWYERVRAILEPQIINYGPRRQSRPAATQIFSTFFKAWFSRFARSRKARPLTFPWLISDCPPRRSSGWKIKT